MCKNEVIIERHCTILICHVADITGTGIQTIAEHFTGRETVTKNYFPLPNNVIEVEVLVEEDFLSRLPNLVPGGGDRRIKITPVDKVGSGAFI